jgi:hypothetical protein
MADTSTLVNTALDAIRPAVNIPNAAALVEQRRSNMGRISELQQQADVAQKNIADVPPIEIPEFKSAPKMPEFKPFKMEGSTVMAFAAMAALGGLGTRQPLTNAMNALSFAIKGYNDGDKQKFDHAYKQFKIENDAIMRQNDQITKELDAKIKGRDQTLEQRKAELDTILKNIGVLKEDTKTIDETYDKAVKWTQESQRFSVEMKKLDLEMQRLRAEQGLEPFRRAQAEASALKAQLDLEKARKSSSGVPGWTDMPVKLLDGKTLIVSQPPPGSEAFMKENKEHAGVVSTFGANVNSMDRLVQTMNRLVNRKDFNLVFGSEDSATLNYMTYLTRIGATDAINDLETIQDSMKTLGLAEIRKSGTPGAITEKEWPILQNQIAAIGPRTNAEEVIRIFNRVAEVSNDAIKNQQDAYGSVWQYRPMLFDQKVMDPSLPTMSVERKAPQEESRQQEAPPREPYADPDKEQRYQDWLKSRGLQ